MAKFESLNLNHHRWRRRKKQSEPVANINWQHSVSHNFYASDLHAKSHLCFYDRTKYINRVRIRFNLGHIFPQFVYLIHIYGVSLICFQIEINKKYESTLVCLFFRKK